MAFWKRIRSEKKTRDSLEFLLEAPEEDWQKDVTRRSRLAKYLEKILLALVLISAYVSITAFYYFILTKQFSNLLIVLFGLGSTQTIFSYQLRRSGLTFKVFRSIAAAGRYRPITVLELRTRCERLVVLFMSTIGLTFGIAQFVGKQGMTRVMAVVAGIEVTDQTLIYGEIFVLLLFTMILVLLRFFELGVDEKYPLDYLNKIKVTISTTLLIWVILSGGISGSLAYALEVPLVLGALFVGAWILTSFIITYYFQYLRGREIAEREWQTAKRKILKK